MVVRVLAAAGMALVLSAGCSGPEPAAGRDAQVQHHVDLPSVDPSTTVSGDAEAGSPRPVFVAYSESSNRLSYLTKDLQVIGRQTQLLSPPSDLVAVGHDVAVGYNDGRVALIEVSSGTTTRVGRIDPSQLGPGAKGVLLDQLFAAPSTLLVAGRFSAGGAQEFSGFVQELDARTLAVRRSVVFDRSAPRDLRTDAQGHALCLLSDGSIVDLSSQAHVRWRRPEKPAYFLPLSGSKVATVTRGSQPTLWLPDGGRIKLGADSGPLGMVDLGAAGYAVLLGDAGAVLRVDATGRQTRLAVPHEPYAALVDDARLLVAQANGNKLVAVGLSPFAVKGAITLDWGIDRIVKVA